MRLLTNHYKKGEPHIWRGRASNPEFGVQYWHEAIKCIDLYNDPEEFSTENQYGLIGLACDEGVRRNFGRVGAEDGPRAIKKQLAKLAWHHQNTKIVDAGVVVCRDLELSTCHDTFSEVIASLLDSGYISIGLGGGHDIAYAHYKGIMQSKAFRGKNIGIINFDAHFDLRPVVKKPNSGTPFHQILTEYSSNTSYLPIGIQKAANTKELFSIAGGFNVSPILLSDCEPASFDIIRDRIELFISKVDAVYLTIDMDCFSAAFAPGVSAATPFGLGPSLVFKCLNYLKSSDKIIAFDIAEANPNYDRDDITMKLAARLIDTLIK